MKKLLFALLFCLPLAGFSQSFNYSEVVEVKGVDKNALYQRAIEWVNENFKSAKAAIQVADKEAGNIMAKGSMELALPAEDFVSFSLSIMVKDGKYKYIMKDFYHTGRTDGGQRNGGDLANEKPECGGGRMTGRYWGKIKTSTAANAEKLVATLNSKMQTQSEVEKF